MQSSDAPVALKLVLFFAAVLFLQTFLTNIFSSVLISSILLIDTACLALGKTLQGTENFQFTTDIFSHNI